MNDVGREIEVVDVEDAFFHAFAQNTSQGRYFFKIELTTSFLHEIDVAEELSAQRPIAFHHIFDQTEVRVDEFHDFDVRRQRETHHFVHFLREMLEFVFDDGRENFLFVSEIGVERAPSFLRGGGNVVHCGAFNALAREKFACHFDEFLACLGD